MASYHSLPMDATESSQLPPKCCPIPSLPSPAASAGPRCSGTAEKGCRILSFLPAACCAFMVYSSITAVWQSHFEPATVFFVVASLTILGLLYLSMQLFEKAVVQNDSVRRDRLKIAIWSLATLLNVLFSYRVTSVLQSPVMTTIIWAIAAVTSALGCYILFFIPTQSTTTQPGSAGDAEDGKARLINRQA